MSMRKNKLKIGLIAINVLVILGLAGSSFYFFNKNRQLNEVLGLSTEEKNVRLIEEINQVYDLPDEQPVVAIVTDPVQFKTDYPTFANAEGGDYLLFFRKARLNVLYRQSEKRVVQTANVVVPITVELVGDAAALEAAAQKLTDFGNQVNVVKTVKPDISQSFVFDVDSDQEPETQSVAKQLGFEIGSTLPTSITPGDQTEIVVAVSADGVQAQPTDAPAEAAAPQDEADQLP